jgi:hypothetical protein
VSPEPTGDVRFVTRLDDAHDLHVGVGQRTEERLGNGPALGERQRPGRCLRHAAGVVEREGTVETPAPNRS